MTYLHAVGADEASVRDRNKVRDDYADDVDEHASSCDHDDSVMLIYPDNGDTWHSGRGTTSAPGWRRHTYEEGVVMVRRVNVFGVTLVAVCLLGATVIAAVSTATMTLPSFSPPTSASIVGLGSTLTTKTGTGIGPAVRCASSAGTLLFVPGSSNLGNYTVDFRGCTNAGEQCHSLGDESGIVLVAGGWSLVLVLLGPSLEKHLWLALLTLSLLLRAGK